MTKPHPQANTLIRQEFKQNDRRFSGEAQTGFGAFDPIAALMRDQNLSQGFKRSLPKFTPEDIAEQEAINAIEAEADREAREEAYRDELLREKSDRLIARSGREG
jgi:hypothetical protein